MDILSACETFARNAEYSEVNGKTNVSYGGDVIGSYGPVKDAVWPAMPGDIEIVVFGVELMATSVTEARVLIAQVFAGVLGFDTPERAC